jgi:hypothetical protein
MWQQDISIPAKKIRMDELNHLESYNNYGQTQHDSSISKTCEGLFIILSSMPRQGATVLPAET